MYRSKSVAVIVPARGGSKGVPGKNLKHLNGKPLIAHTLDCARASGIVDLLAVSTDSPLIARAADAPDVLIIDRPASLATDTAKGVDVFIHAVDSIRQRKGPFDYYFYLQPTSPLRAPADLAGAMDVAIEKGASSVVGVTPCEHHPFWSGVLPPDGSMTGFLKPGTAGLNRQELPPCYRLNGAIFIAGERDSFDGFSFLARGAYAYVMPNERSVDIDSTLDFAVAEVLIRESKIS